ncbi:unnamed protein product [Euphydryas editha]|uniref:Uncharacterized protein n=1 Tax=Euphydryas editha TaxID=104508 RepID=A0AAU9V5Y0_EUPED|nr:unnamed protein product [Euphydryas editha]
MEPIIVENGRITQITNAIHIKIGPTRKPTNAEKTRRTILQIQKSEQREMRLILRAAICASACDAADSGWARRSLMGVIRSRDHALATARSCPITGWGPGPHRILNAVDNE